MKLLVAAVLIFCCGNLWAADQTPIPSGMVRAAFSDKAPHEPWVGQKMTMVVELLAPGYFSGAPEFAFPDIPGVVLVPPVGRPVLGSEEIGGQSYTVQRYEVLLYAQRAGSVEIPPFRIRFAFKTAPLDPTAHAQEILTPKLDFSAKLPPGAENLGTLICSQNLTVTERWNPEPKAAKVGDAFIRTIEFRASGVPGMALPPFPQEEIPGLGIYRKAPVVDNEADGETSVGVRREKITYVCQEPGRFLIPSVTMTWFNLNTQALEKIELSQHELEVMPNPNMVSAAGQSASYGHLGKILGRTLAIGLSIVVTLFLAWRYLPWRLLPRAYDFLRPVRLVPLNPPGPL